MHEASAQAMTIAIDVLPQEGLRAIPAMTLPEIRSGTELSS
ncbi:MAG TPA: hypothetical protein VNS22_22565 [Geminicoccus sp.]|nr:hypothetical protein [Geminicoccus sp.]HWL71142.1 hypothetical protein [Geminicoccus sp.]